MRKNRYLIVACILLIDQLSKFIVRQTMYAGETIPLVREFFHLTYVKNTGAAFSLFEGRSIFLMAIPFLALIFAVWYLEKHIKNHITLIISLILIISGGIGNLIDRAAFGFVTDFFDFRFWPVFNVADIAVCVGCGFLVLYIFFFDDSSKTQKESEAGEV